MAERKARRIRRELTSEERQRWLQARQETENDKDEILAVGRRIKSAKRRAAGKLSTQ